MTFKVNVAGTAWTLEQTHASLVTSLMLATSSDDIKVEYAGFDQALQSLLSPASIFFETKDSVNTANVLCIREKDISSSLKDLEMAITGYPDDAPPLVVMSCPSPKPSSNSYKAFLEKMNKATSPTIIVFDLLDFVPESLITLTPKTEEIAYVPYSPASYSHLSSTIARAIAYLKNPTRAKLCVVDADNTLWQGVTGEGNAKDVVGNVVLMETLKKARDNGLLLALCSKQSEADVVDMFQAHKQWPLSLSDFTAKRITFDKPKSELIKEMLSELSLVKLTDAIFIDDNEVEIAEVSSNANGVETFNIPMQSPEREEYARNLWSLDVFKKTKEDLKRGEMYEDEKKRKAERANNEKLSFADYVKSLNIEVEITECKTEDDKTRVVQLSQRANQFNFTTLRFDKCPDNQVRIVNVKDKHGDYGTVGVLFFSVSSESLVLDNFLMSCRVLGRGVEQRMMAYVGDFAKENNCKSAESLLPEEGKTTVQAEAEKLSAILFNPSHAEESLEKLKEGNMATLEKAQGTPKVHPTESSSSSISLHEITLRMAEASISAQNEEVTLTLAMSKLTSNSGEVDTKAALVDVITSILKDPPSPNDDESLINQGLDSISTVTVISSLSTMLGKDMPNIADFLRSPTIGDWVKVIDGKVEEVKYPFIKHMVKGKKSDAVPIVCMHPMSGLSGAWNVFCREFGPDHDIYCPRIPTTPGPTFTRAPEPSPICGPCCSKISKSNTKKWDTTKPPVSMNMERDSRKDNKNFKADLEHVWNMYDFYRVGYPRDSPCLLDPHPGPAKLLRGDKMFNDAVDDLNTYAGGKYGDLWDTDKHKKMQDVSYHNTMNFFMKHAMFKPHSHGDLPVGGYPVYNQSSGFADPGGLDLYLKFMSSNIVDYKPIDFTVRDEYKNIFNRGPFKGWLMPHNTCMMHEEFVSQLVKSVKGTMGKLELL
ncbi:hypothetical protein TrCOL_g11971 [Triparma columacea]|uniref:Carrier domain-containing protein n=1 Tax=Triparma columacea TaxID=722753 RepID=A0A9W7FVG1_9STRA|nr:hypothetical protein TrCOL_g11971 [Triparma columacea]